MRATQDIASFVHSLGIDPRHLCDTLLPIGFWLKARGDSRKLSDFGLFSGYGDAIDYKGHGVVIIGENSSGKSTISKAFVEYQDATHLSDDTVLLFDPEGDGRLFVYNYRKDLRLEVENDPTRSVTNFAQHLSCTHGVPLEVILHLSPSIDKDEFMEANPNEILRYITRADLTQDIPPQLRNAHYLHLRKRPYNHNPEYVKSVYELVKPRLDAVLGIN